MRVHGWGGGQQALGIDTDGSAGGLGLREKSLLIAAGQLAHPRWIVRRIGASSAWADTRVHLDQLSTVVDPHQVTAVAHLDTLADVLRRHGVQRLGHCQMVIALHPHFAPGRHLVGLLGSR
jgi:hypothetical protein